MEKPEPAPDPRIGSVLQGRYLIISRVAEGGMGTVYRGERIGLGRPVAIKFLHPEIAGQEAFIRRFEVEARAMSRLTHPHCVSVIDFGVEGAPYLVMELVTGRTLREVMNGERLPVPRALRIGRQLLAGVAHAHAQGIIHRDIKPDNVIVAQTTGIDEHARILDFGLARLADGNSGLTAGLAIGTPSYMAPEQTGPGTVDERADVYSVGVVVFELLAGRKPFVSEHVGEIMRMHREAPPPPLRTVIPEADLSAELEAVVLKAMAKKPEDRFPSAAALAAALDGVPESGGPPKAAPEPTTVDRRPAGRALPERTVVEVLRPALRRAAAGIGWVRADRRRTAIVAAGGLAALSLGIWLAARGDGPKPQEATAPAASPSPAAAAGGDPTPLGLAQAEAILASGQREQGLALLTRLRAERPKDPAIAATLARVYFEKRWWSDGIEAFRAAIANDPARRGDAVLIQGVISSLQSERFAQNGEAFLVREIGDPARPHVEEAARDHESSGVRIRAARLIETWGKREGRGAARPPSAPSSSRSPFRW